MMALVFSVAVSGNGQMLEPFVEKLKKQFPGVTVYDRNAEAASSGDDSPSVADIDAIFVNTGSRETATIRSFHRHRFLAYNLDENPTGSDSAERLLKSMIEAVTQLLTPPEREPRQEDNQAETENG